MQKDMQTASSRIWTQVTNSISYYENCYAWYASFCMYVVWLQKCKTKTKNHQKIQLYQKLKMNKKKVFFQPSLEKSARWKKLWLEFEWED